MLLRLTLAHRFQLAGRRSEFLGLFSHENTPCSMGMGDISRHHQRPRTPVMLYFLQFGEFLCGIVAGRLLVSVCLGGPGAMEFASRAEELGGASKPAFRPNRGFQELAWLEHLDLVVRGLAA
jgi:hypothetical protein